MVNQPLTETQIQLCMSALRKNGFEVFAAEHALHAKTIFFTLIYPGLIAPTVSWGDSLTLEETGIIQELISQNHISLIRPFDPDVDRREIMERRRRALLVDLFLTGTNAVTLSGKLVNLDMIGNRTSAIAFGPKQVVLFIGQNKIVPDVDQAIKRIRSISAPRNAGRHKLKTPCATSGQCHDCSSPQRICNTWSIIDKCFPKSRIKIILIKEELGF